MHLCKKPYLLFALLAVMGVALFGCGDGSETPESSGPTTQAAQADDAGEVFSFDDIESCDSPTETVHLGTYLELSGTYQTVGTPILHGIELAVAEVNELGGFTVGDACYDVELVVEDYRGDAAEATAVVQGILRDEEIKYVIGPGLGIGAQPGQELTQAGEEKALHFSNANIWETSGVQGQPDKWGLFRVQVPEDYRTDAYVDAFGEEFPDAERVALLFNDDIVGSSTKSFLVPALEEAGYEIVANEAFPAATTDWSRYLTSIRAANPDVLISGYSAAEQATVTRQALELDAAPAIFGFAIPVSIPLEGATGQPIDIPYIATYTTPNLDDPQTDEIAAFADRLRAEFGFGEELPLNEQYSLYQYDAVQWLIKAMQLAGTVDDTRAVANEILRTHWEGPMGEICFDETQTMIYPVDYARVEDGEVTWSVLPANLERCAA